MANAIRHRLPHERLSSLLVPGADDISYSTKRANYSRHQRVHLQLLFSSTLGAAKGSDL